MTYDYVSHVSHTFATHSSPVYDVTDTDSWAQNGSAQGRVFAIFKPRFSTNKQRQNSSEKLKFSPRTLQFFPFLSVGPVMSFWFSSALSLFLSVRADATISFVV